MTNSNIEKICKALIDYINKETDMKFAQSEKNARLATAKLKNLELSFDIHLKNENQILANVKYILTIDDEQTKELDINELIAQLKAIKDYVKEPNEYFECCFCKKLVKGYGNNPAPVKNSGKCCNECNAEIVIPARLMEM